MDSYLKHEPVLDIEQDFPAFSVVPNQDMQCVAVLDPSQQTSVRRQWNRGIALNVKVAFEAVVIHCEKGIDETEELHDTFVLTQVLMS